MVDNITSDEILKEVEQVDLQELLDRSLHETSSDKKELFHALYTYALGQRQKDIISAPGFDI
ncbi:hypothetical protein HU830_01760 [Lactobacillus sp. DCY120]|uniref:Uncharacterized protein n=1 Tax=Bombilactobacillus apium TaxID=2675299 RepID=A0A850R5N3_9LACO|nr:hypothetical protein [Bombilactobacillus apium]NVY95922.1 hypothetical protein [Bombilactobacillus apium]